MEEVWKDVVGYEDYFRVSNFGNILSKRTNKILKQTISKTGYATVATKIGGRKGKNLCFKVHRLVAEAFLEPPSFGLKANAELTFYGKVPVNHIDGNKLNNNSKNLEWVTYSENTRHAYVSGLLKPLVFENHPSSLFTYSERRDIFLDVKERGCSFRQKARELGCSHHVVSRIMQQFATNS